MDCHLIAIKIGIKSSTNHRMNLNRFSFYQQRLESLNTQSMQSRRPVEKHRMVFNYLLKNFPYFGTLLLNHFLCCFYCSRIALVFQSIEYKRFEQFQGHFFWQPALVKLQVRSHHDDRSSRIIHAFSQQVLAKTTLLTLKHIAQRFQRSLIRTTKCTTSTAIIEQG